jgi:hypothetical protein
MPQIVHAHVPATPGKYDLVKERGERRALSARREVSDAEVAHDRDAERLGQICRLAELEGRRPCAMRMMEHGLTVQTDELRAASDRAAVGGSGVEAAEVVMELGAFPTGGLPARGGLQAALQRLRKAGAPKLQQLHASRRHVAQRAVHAVQARARHDAEHAEGSVLDCDGKRSATPLFRHAERWVRFAMRKRRRRCAPPAHSNWLRAFAHFSPVRKNVFNVPMPLTSVGPRSSK